MSNDNYETENYLEDEFEDGDSYEYIPTVTAEPLDEGETVTAEPLDEGETVTAEPLDEDAPDIEPQIPELPAEQIVRSSSLRQAILLDDMMTHSASGPKFRWQFFLALVKQGEYKGKKVIIPLDFNKSSNNARRTLGKAGLKVNQDYSVMRFYVHEQRKEYIAIAFV